MEDNQTLEEPIIEEQQQEPLQEEPPLKKLYNGLHNDGKYTKSFDDFKSKYSNVEERKKLHKGLVEDGDYTKGIDDFDSQYFSDVKKKDGGKSSGTGAFPSTSELFGSKGETTPRLDGLPVAEQNPIDDVLEANTLSKQTKKIANPDLRNNAAIEIDAPDEEKIAEGKAKEKSLAAKGFGQDFINGVKDLPQAAYDNPTTSKSNLVDAYKTDKFKFKQLTNEAKVKYAIQSDAFNTATNSLPDDENNKYIASQTGLLAGNAYSGDTRPAPQTMNDVYGMIRDKQNIIDQHITNPEEKAKMQGLLKESYSAYINPTTADFKQEYDGSELKGKLDINQYAGLKTMEMFDPEKYKQTLAFINSDKPTEYQQSMGLTFDDSGFKMGGVSDSETKGSIDYKIGKETRLRELNNIGATNQYTALVSENNKIKKQFDGTQNAEEKQALSENYANNQKAILNVQNAEKGDDERYPLTAQLKFDNQVKEIFQNAPSVGEYAASKFTNSLITNTGNSIESLVTGLFGSDKDIAEMQAKRIGENQQFENQIYLPDSYKRENSPVLIQPNKELKKQVDDVLKGRDYKNLNDYEKNIVNNIVANNQDKIETVTNPDAGNTKNYFSKSTGYAVAGFTADIAAFGLKVAALGGLGASASVAEGSVLFMDGFLPAHDKAIAEGKSESEALQYGMLHGGVMALAAKFGSKFDVIKNLVGAGKSPLSKEIAGLSEETWNSIVNKNKSLIGRLGNSLKEVGKEQGKMIGTFGLLAPGATALADNALGYEHKSLGEIGGELAHSVKEMVIGSSLLIGVGLAKGLSSHTANPIEKAAIWDMADNPDIGKARIDEAVQSGELTADKGEQRKKEIDNISALVEKVPLKNDKGNPLTDAERVNYLYDLAVSKKNKDAAKNLPTKQSEAAIKESKVADYRNSILLENYTDKQREDRKTALDKILNPKDIDGKKQEVPNNIRLETEAELQALNEATPKGKVVNPILQKLEGNEVLNNIKGDDEGKIDYLKEQAISAPESFGRKIKDEETHIDLISQNTKENIEEAIKYQEKRLGEDNADVEVIDKGITLLEKGLAKKNEQPIGETDINSQLKTTDNGKETNAQAQAEEERRKENVLTTDGNTAPDEKGAVPLPIKEGGIKADVVGKNPLDKTEEDYIKDTDKQLKNGGTASFGIPRLDDITTLGLPKDADSVMFISGRDSGNGLHIYDVAGKEIKYVKNATKEDFVGLYKKVGDAHFDRNGHLYEKKDKVVGSDVVGSGVVVYHGSPFNRFSAKDYIPNRHGLIFFTKNKNFAEKYMVKRDDLQMPEGAGVLGEAGVSKQIIYPKNTLDYNNIPSEVIDILENYGNIDHLDGKKLGMGNGYDYSEAIQEAAESGDWSLFETKKVIDKLKELGYDSIKLRNENGYNDAGQRQYEDVIAVFDKTLIKDEEVKAVEQSVPTQEVKAELPLNKENLKTKTNTNEKANESNGQSMLDRVSEAGDKSKVGEDSEQLRKEEEVKKLEVKRDNEIDKVSKPDLKLNFVDEGALPKEKETYVMYNGKKVKVPLEQQKDVPNQKLVDRQNELKKVHEKILSLINCITKTK